MQLERRPVSDGEIHTHHHTCTIDRGTPARCRTIIRTKKVHSLMVPARFRLM